MTSGLRRLRLEREMSRFDLAVAVGINPQSIYQWESHRQRPSEANVQKLCEFFEVTEEELDLKPFVRTGPKLEKVS